MKKKSLYSIVALVVIVIAALAIFNSGILSNSNTQDSIDETDNLNTDIVEENGGDVMAETIRASHILVGTSGEAEDIIQQLNDGADFADLAQEHSKCPSRSQGGDLGEFGKGVMVKEFETAAFALEVGEVSGPVQTQFGWHVIKRTE